MKMPWWIAPILLGAAMFMKKMNEIKKSYQSPPINVSPRQDPLEEFIDVYEQKYGTHCWHCNGKGTSCTPDGLYVIVCPRCKGEGRVRK